ncbi:substrate-binding domain-containing protein [Epidermidibacterium keratini]|uniref:Substrate-binding domain-containing protein n=2 Tax=Epidermidibacterium keratini TaxID=1891644 RepID=A0A7L4YT05_9ACTN|nr:substrate-binding domain-containing protein [Epidermidibacterium keratini]
METNDAGAAEAKSGEITVAVLQKQGDQQYFVDEAQGAQEKADELGDIDVNVINLGTDSNKAINEVDNVIAQGVDGIIIVVPDTQIGPQVIDAARNAGIPLLAADDAIKGGDGKAAPFVGFDGTAMGEEVGTEAAKLYTEAGWTPENTKIIAAWKQDLQTCNDRVAGAQAAFSEATGGAMPEIIEIGTDNSATDAQNKAGAVLTSNSDVQNWVVWGCNDENQTGVVTALQNGGISAQNIIGVGLGGYLTCKDWQAGQESGNKAALFISGYEVGSSAMDVMNTAIREGEALPAETIANTNIVDPTNWEESGLVCT